MKLPNCPNCQNTLQGHPHVSKGMWACTNHNCTPLGSHCNFYHFIQFSNDETHIDNWGIQLFYKDKFYYLISTEDSYDEDDNVDGDKEDIILIPTQEIPKKIFLKY